MLALFSTALGWAFDFLPPLRWAMRTFVSMSLEIQLNEEDAEGIAEAEATLRQHQGPFWGLPFIMMVTNHDSQRRERIRRVSVEVDGRRVMGRLVGDGAEVTDIWIEPQRDSPMLHVYAEAPLRATGAYQILHGGSAMVVFDRVGAFPRRVRKKIPLAWALFTTGNPQA
jgi:hypothetical protein